LRDLGAARVEQEQQAIQHNAIASVVFKAGLLCLLGALKSEPLQHASEVVIKDWLLWLAHR
jgi:hypothetical protein